MTKEQRETFLHALQERKTGLVQQMGGIRLPFSLLDLQIEQAIWCEKNFPNQTAYQTLLGIGEEFGELCHAHLKAEQGIRGSAAEHHAAKMDAVADMVVFIAGYCTMNGIDFDGIVHQTWIQVRRRDWTKNPVDGRVGHEAGKCEECGDYNHRPHCTLLGKITPDIGEGDAG